MNLPNAFLQSLEGLPGYEREDFLAAHNEEKAVTAIRLNPNKSDGVLQRFADQGIDVQPVPWSADGYYLSSRPSFTFDPLFHAGSYYVQDPSSMFLEQAIKQSVPTNQALRALDLCAAPGGKSTLIQSLLSKDSLLVSNEVIRQRAAVLKENIIKWAPANVAVTHNDPRDFSRLPGFFDLIVVDAPCSGSGLFRKDHQAVEQWSENNVMLCSQRQQRILADVMPALKTEGILIYATCSYSRLEDESILDWLTTSFPLEPVVLDLDPAWTITSVVTPGGNCGYRFWPHLVQGEGFFLAVFRNKATAVERLKSTKPLRLLSQKFVPLTNQWADTRDSKVLDINGTLYAWPEALVKDYAPLLDVLRLIYSGVLLGDLAHQKLIPAHALALSSIVNTDIPRVEVDDATAINYLKKNVLEFPDHPIGWHLLSHHTHILGWVNVLKNRVNNYYPKEWRILKA